MSEITSTRTVQVSKPSLDCNAEAAKARRIGSIVFGVAGGAVGGVFSGLPLAIAGGASLGAAFGGALGWYGEKAFCEASNRRLLANPVYGGENVDMDNLDKSE